MKRILIAVAIMIALAISMAGAFAATAKQAPVTGCPMMQSGSTAGCPMMHGKQATCPMSKDCASCCKTKCANGKCTMKMKDGKCQCPNCAKAKQAPKTAPKATHKIVSAVCPVMGTKIPDVTKAAGKSVYKGKTYYFCCMGCKPAFDKNPEKYIKK